MFFLNAKIYQLLSEFSLSFWMGRLQYMISVETDVRFWPPVSGPGKTGSEPGKTGSGPGKLDPDLEKLDLDLEKLDPDLEKLETH